MPGYPAVATHVVAGILDLYSLRPVGPLPNQAVSCDVGMLVLPQITMQTAADGMSVSFTCQGLSNMTVTMACPPVVSMETLPPNAVTGTVFFGFDGLGNFLVGDGSLIAPDGPYTFTSCAGACTHVNSLPPGGYLIASVTVNGQGPDSIPGFYPTSTIAQQWTGYPAQPVVTVEVPNTGCVPPAVITVQQTASNVWVTCQ